ncbi:MAG: ABC transporter permease [Muribaculaceae bacterium]
MKRFLVFVKKEFLHILRDTRTMLILLVLPVVATLLFGFAITTEVRNTKVGVLVPNRNEVTERIVQRIDASQYFTVTTTFNHNDEILPSFENGEVSLVLVFNHNNSALQLVADGSEPNQASMVVNYAQGILASCIRDMQNASGVQPVIDIAVRMLYNPQQRSVYTFVPGVMGLILMLICAMMTSIAIVREKEQGTMEVLLASPLPPYVIIAAKLIPYVVISMVNIASIMLLAVFVLDVPIVGSLSLLVGITLLFVMLSLSLGLLVSTVTETQMAAMLVSGMVMMMPVMLLSGMIFNIEAMPEVLQWLSCIVPARWYIEAVKMVMLQGCTFCEIWRDVAILVSMTIVILTISIKNFKVRLS